MSQIIVIINDEKVSLPENSTVKNMLDNLKLDVEKIAVELNMEIVPSDCFESQVLDNDDRVEIVHFIGGG